MHVAYLVNQYPKVSHTFIRREILALEKLGLQVTRFALRSDGTEQVDPRDKAEHARTRYVTAANPFEIAFACLQALLERPVGMIRSLGATLRLGRRSHSGVIKHLLYLVEACVLRRWMAQSGASHLHVHFGTNSATVALLLHYLSGTRYSFTIHGPEEFDMPRALALAEKIRGAQFVVAISSFCRSQIFRWADTPDHGKVHVVRCAVDLAEFTGAGMPGTANRFLCIGRLSPEKGQAILLQALHLLSQRGLNPEVVLAGDGPLRGDLERMATTLGIAGQVRITGWIPGQAVREELQKCRALLLPSFAEGLPVVIMEALAEGRPVVSTFVAGIPELVTEECGWLVPAGDAAAFATAMERAIAATDALAVTMGEAGRARVTRMHDGSIEAAKLAQLFRSTD